MHDEVVTFDFYNLTKFVKNIHGKLVKCYSKYSVVYIT